MPEPVKVAFERRVFVLPLSQLLPVRRVPDSIKQTARYRRILVPRSRRDAEGQIGR
jgi:hypothetical protein